MNELETNLGVADGTNDLAVLLQLLKILLNT